MDDALPKMYTTLAEWWPLLSPPSDYEEEGAFYRRVFEQHVQGDLRTLVEFGCGGGHNTSHMKAGLSVTMTDLSPAMLDVARRLNPDCEHLLGDMRTLRLGRVFDAVIIHDAIDYMLNEEDLRAAMATAFIHCRPGGVAIFAPDDTEESFMPMTNHGGTDDGDRGVRYMEWSHAPEGDATTWATDYVYLLRRGAEAVEVVHDRHIHGLFARESWLSWVAEAGFTPETTRSPWGVEVFIGLRPAA